MPSGSLVYSQAACDVLPLFRKKHLVLLMGGVEKKSKKEMVKPGEDVSAIGDPSDGLPTSFVSSISVKKQRMPGLNRGTIKLSEDFDDPLPDEFWLGVD